VAKSASLFQATILCHSVRSCFSFSESIHDSLVANEKLAVDVPSGVDPDTGNRNLPQVIADMTVTFHRMKVGMPKAKDVCGEIFVEKIGIPPEAEIGVL